MIGTRTKVLIDAAVGAALVRLLNICARILGRLLRPDHSFARSPATIVVAKYLGMGSIIQATPLLQTLRRNFPHARLLLVTAERNRALGELIAPLDGVWTVDDDGLLPLAASTLRLLAACWRARVDLYIDLDTYSNYSAAVATMSCARNRLGYYRAERNFRMGVYTHMMFFNARAPIAESFLQMARLAGCREIVTDLYRFPVTDAARQRCAVALQSLGASLPPRYVVINPNASDMRLERRWPAERFVELVGDLAGRFPDHAFVFIGATNEAAYVSGLCRQLGDASGRVVNTAGALALDELFALLDGATLVVTNDTGPMHMACAVGRPTVSLFGPVCPWQFGGNRHVTGVYKNLYCSPCVHEFLEPPCRGDNQCMQQITVEEVRAACVPFLAGERSIPGEAAREAMRFCSRDGTRALGVVERAG